jgi:hypothetical protein
MQGTLETLYGLGFFPFLLAPLMAEPLAGFVFRLGVPASDL